MRYHDLNSPAHCAPTTRYSPSRGTCLRGSIHPRRSCLKWLYTTRTQGHFFASFSHRVGIGYMFLGYHRRLATSLACRDPCSTPRHWTLDIDTLPTSSVSVRYNNIPMVQRLFDARRRPCHGNRASSISRLARVMAVKGSDS